jgi:hypothetical protein
LAKDTENIGLKVAVRARPSDILYLFVVMAVRNQSQAGWFGGFIGSVTAVFNVFKTVSAEHSHKDNFDTLW